MQRDEFIVQGSDRAHLDSRGGRGRHAGHPGDAGPAHPRLDGGQAGRPAPPERGEILRRVEYATDVPHTGVPMSRQGFLDRIAQRAGAEPKVVHQARSVVDVLQEATEGALTDRIRQAREAELAEILFSGSTTTADS